MACTLDEWLKVAKGLQVYQNKDSDLCGNIVSGIFSGSKNRANHSFSRSYKLSSKCSETLEMILNHPAINKDQVLITDNDTVQIFLKFDLDVRITVDLCSGKCDSDPYLDSVTDVDNLLTVLNNPSLVRVIPLP